MVSSCKSLFVLLRDSRLPIMISQQSRNKKKRAALQNMPYREKEALTSAALLHTVFVQLSPFSMLAYPSGIAEPDGPTFLIMLMCYKALCLFFHSLICSWGIRRYRPWTYCEVVCLGCQNKACSGSGGGGGGCSNAQHYDVAQLNTKPPL